ncbi:hypothetical protein TNIN_455911 [Trichonephila inaurata madagascariensis]|uniref:Uncharacterized protein n=1 Tax=Trichonephila inaurata madagascariensis TaxID=2747483 RepID=A0A8X6X6A5_9ARAC|nr:hypothetical protein TNIN_455911 [Trichonephila inaurata madagascariensis]
MPKWFSKIILLMKRSGLNYPEGRYRVSYTHLIEDNSSPENHLLRLCRRLITVASTQSADVVQRLAVPANVPADGSEEGLELFV